MENSLMNKFFDRFINIYTTLTLKRHFKGIRIVGEYIPDSRSILLTPNHFSWWDGFFAWRLNATLLRKKFHMMMLEQELARHRFLFKLGAFPIASTSKGLLESFRYASKVLSRPNNLLVFYPQGKLYSQHHMSLEFRKGIERIVEKAGDFRLLMCASLVDYYTHPKPTLTIYLQEYDRITNFDLIQFQMAYNLFLKQSIYKQDKIYRQ